MLQDLGIQSSSLTIPTERGIYTAYFVGVVSFGVFYWVVLNAARDREGDTDVRLFNS